MEVSLTTIAIHHALNQNWKDAIKVNLELLDQNGENVEALNRLAYAYLKRGQLTLAKTTYKKVLKIDKYNPIALKNFKWLSNLNKNDIIQDSHSSPAPTIFLEEPGKTKLVSLVNLAPARILCNLITAQKVFLNAKRRTVEIRDGRDVYIGALPDDISYRLIRMIESGNQYDAYVKNVAKNAVVVFVRELKRGKKYADIPSFSIGVYHTATSKQTLDPDSDEEDKEEAKETDDMTD